MNVYLSTISQNDGTIYVREVAADIISINILLGLLHFNQKLYAIVNIYAVSGAINYFSTISEFYNLSGQEQVYYFNFQ